VALRYRGAAFVARPILMTECLVHGFDIARAESRPWTIDPADATMATAGVAPMLPQFVDEENAKGLSACFEVRLRGAFPIYFVVDDAKLTVDAVASRRIDCRISADPAAYLLVGYGRMSLWSAILRGKLVSFGRKPWLGLKLGRLFVSP
jgi:hypothetical protein